MAGFSDSDVVKIKHIQRIFKYHGDTLFNRLEDKENFYLTGGIFARLWHSPIEHMGLDLRSWFRSAYPQADMDIYCKSSDKQVLARAFGANSLDYYTIDRDENAHYGHDYIFATVDCDKTDTTNKLYTFVARFIQFMYNPSGPPNKVIDTFDFEHAKIWYDFATNELHISPYQLWLIKNKKYQHYKHLSKNFVKRQQKMESMGWTEHHPAIADAVKRADNRNW